MERRELFKILAATAASQASAQHPHGAALDLSSYKPHFFSASEYDMLDRLCEIIIPADEQSPGAHQAQVRYYLDVMVGFSDPQNQQRWRAGLQAVEEEAQASFGKTFLACAAPQQDSIVA